MLPPTYIPRPYDHPLGHLLHPLQANLGYYEGSVAIPVDRMPCLTGLGDPAFMMEQRSGVLRCLVRPVVFVWKIRRSSWVMSSPSRFSSCVHQVKLEVFIAPVKEAEKFLGEQWPQQPLIRMSKEELIAKISIVQKNIKQPGYTDIEEVQRRIKDQFAVIEDMQKWLDKYLKN